MRLLLFILAVLVPTSVFGEEPQTLYWEGLLPEGELELLEELFQSQDPTTLPDHSSDESAEDGTAFQLGTFNVVEELDGQLVRIPGFVVPFEYVESGKITEFLLVPYFGACIHYPPPPPNQIVYVTADKPANLGLQWDAIWAVGVLRTKKRHNDLGDAAYTLELQGWEIYDG